jgi:hypothetical protein
VTGCGYVPRPLEIEARRFARGDVREEVVGVGRVRAAGAEGIETPTGNPGGIAGRAGPRPSPTGG